MTNIASGNAIAEVAALIGDLTRANMLTALIDGRALTAGELAIHAGVTAQTASGHLARLLEGRMVVVERQGRHRYYRLASGDIAQAIESLMTVAAAGPKRYRPPGPKDAGLRLARSCYDHIAGRLGVVLAERLSERGHVHLSDGAGIITRTGTTFLTELGVDLDAPSRTRRPLCRTCLDWSERRPHLAGRLGAALFDRLLDLKWIARIPDSRALWITAAGERGFAMTCGIRPDMLRGEPVPRR